MLTIIVMSICLCILFALYRLISGGVTASVSDFLFDVVISLFMTLVVSSLLMMAITLPISDLTMSEPRVETTYHSEDVSFSCKKKSVKIEIGEDAISLSQKSLTIKTASDNPEIQARLDGGESVLEIYVQVSELTLLEKRTYVLYVTNETANMAFGIFDKNENNESED